MTVRRVCLVALLLLIAGCDMFGEYEARKQQTKQRLMSGGAPAAAAAPADPNAAQPMPAPMP